MAFEKYIYLYYFTKTVKDDTFQNKGQFFQHYTH